MTKKILWGGSFLILFLVAMAFLPYSSHSLLPPATTITNSLATELNEMTAALPFVFGGPILAVDECTCSGGWRILVGPPRPMDLLYQPPISTLFSFYNIFTPGPFALGTYIPGGYCSRGTTFCTGSNVAGTIILVGTSGLPL